MPTRNVSLTEHFDQSLPSGSECEQEDRAKIEWLRSASKEGFDAAGRGDYVALRSDREIDDFVDQVRREVTEKLADEQSRG